MFSRIVAGTDGSADSQCALRAAAELVASNPAASVDVVTAHQPLTARQMSDMAAQLPDEFRSVLSAHMGAESTLAQARTIFGLDDKRVKYHELNQDPTDAILDLAERSNADLIVVGSRGEGMVKRAMHGSVSTKVLHHAPCSVLVVKDSEI